MTAKLTMVMADPIITSELRVLYGDTDAAGVVYNATYLRYFELGRGDFMRSCGLPYKLLEDRGYILPIVESYVRYKSPARYDDLLTIETCLAELSSFSCRFHCRILLGDDKRLVVKGFTHHASINRQGKLTPLPDDVIDVLSGYLAGQ